jgi:hypothetical protein
MRSGPMEISSRRIAPASLRDMAGLCLATGSIIAASAFCLHSQPAASIQTPEILAIFSVLVLLPVRQRTQVDTVRKITLFYLLAVLLNMMTSQYFAVSLPGGTANVSYTVIVMIPLAVAAVLSKQKLPSFPKLTDREILSCWYAAFAVIVGHMIVLALLLRKFYGYGYERNLETLGNISLYFLLFMLVWRRLDSAAFRCVVGVTLLLFNIAVSISNRLA